MRSGVMTSMWRRWRAACNVFDVRYGVGRMSLAAAGPGPRDGRAVGIDSSAPPRGAGDARSTRTSAERAHDALPALPEESQNLHFPGGAVTVAICLRPGLIATALPLLRLTSRRSPLGASAIPSGRSAARGR
jgi:hypothetical protein